MTRAEAKSPPGPDLLFDWPVAAKHHLPVLWPGMILLAAVAHLGALAFFHLIFPAPKAQELPPRPLYALRTADLTPAEQAWLEAADPAAFSPAHTDEERLGQASLRLFQPGYLADRPPLLQPDRMVGEKMERSISDAPFLFYFAPLEETAVGPGEESNAGWALHWVGGDALGGSPQRESVLAAPGSHGGAEQPPWFLIGVLPEGIPAVVTLIRSSGDESWDEAMAGYLRALRWTPRSGTDWRWQQATLRPAGQENSTNLSEDLTFPPPSSTP